MGLIVAPWKFDVLKTSKFAREVSLLAQMFVLRTSNPRGETINQNAMENSARIERVAISYLIRKNGNMLQNAITYLKNFRRQGHPVVLCHDWTLKYARHFGCHV